MIREQDLLDAIAECQGERNPNANTCIKLAAYYTILDHIKPKAETYSFAAPGVIEVEGESEFLRAVRGLSTEDVFQVMDELMDTVQVLAPKLYNLTMSRLMDI